MDLDLDIRTSALDALSNSPIKAIGFNVSDFNEAVLQVGEDTRISALSDPDYEQFLADVWVGIVLTLMVLSCVCFMCSCLIYHKVQEWKHRDTFSHGSNEAGIPEVDLPSYTIASGLPTYEEALEQMKRVQEKMKKAHQDIPKTKPGGQDLNSESRTNGDQSGTLSMFSLFSMYNRNSAMSSTTKPS